MGLSSKTWSTRKWRLFAWLLLTTLVVFFFRVWIGEGLPASPRREALAHFTYIWQVADYLRQGYLYADWDPSFFAGYPWLRFLQPAVCYLIALLSLVPGMSLPVALKGFIVATYVLSAWTMAELVHTIVRARGDAETIAWGAGIVGGAAYAIFPFHLRLGIEIVSHAAFWAVLPLPLLVYEAGRSSDRIEGAGPPSPQPSAWKGEETTGIRAVLLGLMFALYGLVDIEHTVLFGPFAVLYILLRDLPMPSRRRWKVLGLLVGAGLIALGLLAFYWLPGLAELPSVGITARFGAGGTASEQFARDTGVSIGALLAGIADRIGIRYRPQDLPAIVFGFFGPNSWYLGIITLVLAVLSLPSVRRVSVVAVAGFLLLLSFAWAARAWLPVNLFRGIPFFATLSGFRGMMHIGFFLCLLAGLGAAGLLAGLRRSPAQVSLILLVAGALLVDRPRPTLSYVAQVLIAVVLLVVVLFVARRPVRPRLSFVLPTLLATVLLVLLVAIDSRPAAASVVTLPRYFEPDELDAYAWLSEQGGDFRIWEYSDVYADAEFLHTFSLAYNQTPRFGGYYDNGATRSQWQLYKWAKPELGHPTSAEALRVALRVSAVRYVLVHRRVPAPDQAIALLRQAGFVRVAWQTTNVTIMEDPDWLPMGRVYTQSLPVHPDILSQRELLPQAERAHWAMYDESGTRGSAAPGDLPPASPPQAVPIIRRGPHRIDVSVSLDQPGLLVVAEAWHPNWRVHINGREVPLLQANAGFLGVRLDAGRSTVQYSYRVPPSLLLGWVISGLTMALLAFLWLCPGVKKWLRV